MAKFRFRKSKKIMPGITLNLSKSGLGISAGPKGAKVSRSATGRTSGSLGIPGSGISVRKQFNSIAGYSKTSDSDSSFINDIKNKALFESIHGKLLSVKEIRRALIPLTLLLVNSMILPLAFITSEVLWIPLLITWCLLIFDYTRKANSNKNEWNLRAAKHLQNCGHTQVE